MEIDKNQTEEMANLLYYAEKEGKGLKEPIRDLWKEIDIDDAYAIQLHNIDRRVSGGEKIVGKKIGLTSLAMQRLLNVNEPDYGILLDTMHINGATEVKMNTILQPQVEGEIAFVLKKDLIGPNVKVEDVIEATDYVVGSIEIISSRIKDYNIKLVDTVADNASAGAFILGDKKLRLDQIDLLKEEMQFYKNGELINSGFGEDAMGNPALCLAWLANKLYQYGVNLKKGEVILSGALSAAFAVDKGDRVEARFNSLASVFLNFI